MIRRLIEGRMRSVLLLLGLLGVSTGILLVASASQTTVILVDQELSRYWRTSYDILVRPTGARSPIEEKYGLVEANHLSGIFGGINMEQYKEIKTIPGVDVAAPIAMLGYIYEIVPTNSVGQLNEHGAYVTVDSLIINDGTISASSPALVRSTYYYIGSDADQNALPTEPNLPIVNPAFAVSSYLEFPFLMAGIDPPQEKALVGLDEALVEGKYLLGDEPLNAKPYEDPIEHKQLTLIGAPVLINSTSYISMTLHTELKQLELPLEASTLKEIMALGGTKYLATLPGVTSAVHEVDGSTIYDKLVEQFKKEVPTSSYWPGRGFILTFSADLPGEVVYQEIAAPFSHAGLTLEIVLPGGRGYGNTTAYRRYSSPNLNLAESQFNVAFLLNVKGTINVAQIPMLSDLNRVPLETYFPPVAILRYDEHGQAIEPRTVRPTLNTAGYIQPPPLILTTLDAAQAIRGDAAISAIRIRVGGIVQLTPQAQRKIESIATEIQKRTGLVVDVMVGSSPTSVLVHVPGVGYVEEQWIKKGVNVSYAERIQSGNWLLMGILLGICGLFSLDLTWSEVIAQRWTITLQKALGWRSRTVFAQFIRKQLMIGIIAAVISILLTWGSTQIFVWQSPSKNLLIEIPLLILAICLVGGLFPIWRASCLPPILGLQQGAVSHKIKIFQRSMNHLWVYAWYSIIRRWSRTVLSIISAALSSALLVLLLAATLERQGALSGTLLGEFILIEIKPYHYAIAVIGFGLASFSMANSLLVNAVERRREIGVLKAIGWRTGIVSRLFILEGIIIGIIGGIGGSLLGCIVIYILYKVFPLVLAPIVIFGVAVPGLVGVLAAFFPSQVAARVAPSEAVRFE
jgi:hypothetical protein